MDKRLLFAGLDGLFAYDTGAVDSGIHDDLLKERIKVYLIAECKSNSAYPEILNEFLKEYYLHPPYTLEDVKSFIEWVDELLEN